MKRQFIKYTFKQACFFLSLYFFFELLNENKTTKIVYLHFNWNRCFWDCSLWSKEKTSIRQFVSMYNNDLGGNSYRRLIKRKYDGSNKCWLFRGDKFPDEWRVNALRRMSSLTINTDDESMWLLLLSHWFCWRRRWRSSCGLNAISLVELTVCAKRRSTNVWTTSSRQIPVSKLDLKGSQCRESVSKLERPTWVAKLVHAFVNDGTLQVWLE